MELIKPDNKKSLAVKQHRPIICHPNSLLTNNLDYCQNSLWNLSLNLKSSDRRFYFNKNRAYQYRTPWADSGLAVLGNTGLCKEIEEAHLQGSRGDKINPP